MHMRTVIHLCTSNGTPPLEAKTRHLRARRAIQQTVAARQITRGRREIVVRSCHPGGMQIATLPQQRKKGTRTPEEHERPGQRPDAPLRSYWPLTRTRRTRLTRRFTESSRATASLDRALSLLTCCFATPWRTLAPLGELRVSPRWVSSGSRPPRRHSASAAAPPINRAVRSHG
jgi:hypothetical protein